jgi:hypothetical protein
MSRSLAQTDSHAMLDKEDKAVCFCVTVQKLEYWYQERDAARVSRIASLIDSSISSSE